MRKVFTKFDLNLILVLKDKQINFYQIQLNYLNEFHFNVYTTIGAVNGKLGVSLVLKGVHNTRYHVMM